jgi:hypothetical protein
VLLHREELFVLTGPRSAFKGNPYPPEKVAVSSRYFDVSDWVCKLIRSAEDRYMHANRTEEVHPLTHPYSKQL